MKQKLLFCMRVICLVGVVGVVTGCSRKEMIIEGDESPPASAQQLTPTEARNYFENVTKSGAVIHPVDFTLRFPVPTTPVAAVNNVHSATCDHGSMSQPSGVALNAHVHSPSCDHGSSGQSSGIALNAHVHSVVCNHSVDNQVVNHNADPAMGSLSRSQSETGITPMWSQSRATSCGRVATLEVPLSGYATPARLTMLDSISGEARKVESRVVMKLIIQRHSERGTMSHFIVTMIEFEPSTRDYDYLYDSRFYGLVIESDIQGRYLRSLISRGPRSEVIQLRLHPAGEPLYPAGEFCGLEMGQGSTKSLTDPTNALFWVCERCQQDATDGCRNCGLRDRYMCPWNRLHDVQSDGYCNWCEKQVYSKGIHIGDGAGVVDQAPRCPLCDIKKPAKCKCCFVCFNPVCTCYCPDCNLVPCICRRCSICNRKGCSGECDLSPGGPGGGGGGSSMPCGDPICNICYGCKPPVSMSSCHICPGCCQVCKSKICKCQGMVCADLKCEVCGRCIIPRGTKVMGSCQPCLATCRLCHNIACENHACVRNVVPDPKIQDALKSIVDNLTEAGFRELINRCIRENKLAFRADASAKNAIAIMIDPKLQSPYTIVMNSTKYANNMGDIAAKLMLIHELFHMYLNIANVEASKHHYDMVHNEKYSAIFMQSIKDILPGMDGAFGNQFYYQAIRGGTYGDRGGDTSGEKGAEDFATKYGLP